MCQTLLNCHGPLAVTYARPDYLSLHPTAVPELSLRMSLLQPHSGVWVARDQRGPTRHPFHHRGQSANLQQLEAPTVNDLSSNAPAVFGRLPFWSVRVTLKRLLLINSLWPPFDVNQREGLLFWPSNYSLFLRKWAWHTPWSSVVKMFNNALFFFSTPLGSRLSNITAAHEY